jgi:DNA-directed RNA polymerase specialized sigma24 family protein
MASVPRDEWSGWATYERSDERDARGRRTLLHRTYHAPAVDPLPAVAIADTSDDVPRLVPAALQTAIAYDDQVYIAEGLRFLQAPVNGQRLDYIQRTLHEEGPQDIAAHYGVTCQTVQQALKRTRQRVQRWSQEISYAAAD